MATRFGSIFLFAFCCSSCTGPSWVRSKASGYGYFNLPNHKALYVAGNPTGFANIHLGWSNAAPTEQVAINQAYEACLKFAREAGNTSPPVLYFLGDELVLGRPGVGYRELDLAAWVDLEKTRLDYARQPGYKAFARAGNPVAGQPMHVGAAYGAATPAEAVQKALHTCGEFARAQGNHETPVLHAFGDEVWEGRDLLEDWKKHLAGLGKIPVVPPPNGRRWALIVGIDQYQDARLPAIRSARANVRQVREWMLSPQGGYARENVRVLEGKDATLTNLRSALHNWAQGAIAEDTLTVYYCGHVGHTGNHLPVFIPHDADKDKLESTAYGFHELAQAAERFFNVNRVVLYMDAPHDPEFGMEEEAWRKLADGMASNSKQVCLVSAASGRGLSLPGATPDGVGLFADSLRSAWSGAADRSRDRNVTVEELRAYLELEIPGRSQGRQRVLFLGNTTPSFTLGTTP